MRIEKLYNLSRHQYVQIVGDTEAGGEVRVPPEHIDPPKCADIIWFGNVDGMYSYCIDGQGNLISPAAWTTVIPVPEHEVPQEIKDAVNNSRWYNG